MTCACGRRLFVTRRSVDCSLCAYERRKQRDRQRKRFIRTSGHRPRVSMGLHEWRVAA